MRTTLLIAGTIMMLAGCAELDVPKRGFMTRTLLGPETRTDISQPPSSYRFCVARRYTPGTTDFERCRYSIDSQKAH